MPGSWEQSRLSEIEVRLTRTLLSQPLRRVFCFRSMAHSKRPGESRDGRPGSRGSRREACGSKARGLPEGTRRKPDTDGGANLEGSLRRRAVQGAATKSLSFGLPRLAARRTLVVKISDTSLRRSGVRIPPLTSRTVEAASQGRCDGARFFRQEEPALTPMTSDIACSPASLCNCRCAASARRW